MSTTYLIKEKEKDKGDAQEARPVSTLTPARYHPEVAIYAALGALCLALVFNLLAVLIFPQGIHVWFVHIQPGWERWVMIDILITLASFGALTIFWNVRMIEKPQRDEQKRLNKEIERLNAEIQALEASRPEPVNTGYLAMLSAYTLITRHIQGKGISREECAKELKMEQGHWNRAVEILRKLGLLAGEKKGMKFNTPDPQRLLGELAKVGEVSAESFYIKWSPGHQSRYFFESKN